MNESPSPLPGMRRGSFESGKHGEIEDNRNANLQRYSRSKLYALRNDARSQRRPDCALRLELQTLGFWKYGVSGTTNEMIVGGSALDDDAILASQGAMGGSHYAAGAPSSHVGARNRERQMNMRERPINFQRGIRISGGPGDCLSHAGVAANPTPKTFIDQRSSSIAHLMPAFAKKRIAAAQQNACDSSINNDGSDSRDSESSFRQGRTKEFMFEQQRRVGNDFADYTSPHKKAISEHDPDGSGGSQFSSVPISNTRHVNSLHERRIGSGRLLPRDVNWEYHSHEVNKDKNSIGHQQRNAARFVERAQGSAGSSNYSDKRLLERRNGSGGSNDKYEGNSSIHSARRFPIDDTQNSMVQLHGRNSRRNDEPEWFSGGPTSQNDTIELRGFEDPDENHNDDNFSRVDKPKRERQLSGDGDSSHSSSNLNLSPCSNEMSSKDSEYNTACRSNGAGSSPIKVNALNPADGNDISADMLPRGMEGKLPKRSEDQIATQSDMSQEFNFDAFLNMDPLDHDLMRSDTDHIKNDSTFAGGSRFSRWFAKSDEAVQGRQIANAPDSSKDVQKSINLLEFLQHAKVSSGAGGPRQIEIPSVEELEARMRKVDIEHDEAKTMKHKDHIVLDEEAESMGSSEQMQKHPPASQDLEAFKKLLEQLNAGMKKEVLPFSNNPSVLEQEAHSVCVAPPSPALGMLAHMGILPPDNQPPPLMSVTPGAPRLGAEDLKRIMHLHQQQIPQPDPMSPSSQQQHQHGNMGDGSGSMAPHVFADEQAKRRDFLNLLQSVARGQIHLGFLEKELNNPNTPMQTKEILSAVIRESTRSMTPSLGINMMTAQPGQMPVQLMRASPVPHQQGMPSPIPMGMIPSQQMVNLPNQLMMQVTPPTERMQQPHHPGQPIGLPNQRDLHIRTQVIMQNALLKKKMEEQQQQDAIRRRNEMQKQQHPQTNQSVQQLQQQQQHSPQHQSQIAAISSAGQQSRHLNSPTPLAFTPTSVLRKMTAEKDNTSAQHQQTLHQLQPAGVQSQLQQQQKLQTPSQNKLGHTVFMSQNQQQQVSAAIAQPRMILGGNHPTSAPQPQSNPGQQQQQPQHLNPPISPQALPPQAMQQMRMPPSEMKWPIHLVNQSMPLNKPMGRPILKGPPLSIPQQVQQPMQQIQASQPNQQVPPMIFPSKIEFQQIQQQRLKNNQTPQHMLSQQTQSQGFVAQHLQQQLPQGQNVLHVQHPQLFQQQHHVSLQQQQHMQLQRQLHQQLHPQPQPAAQDQEPSNRNVNIVQPQITPQTSSPESNAPGNNAAGNILVYPREGGLSPTSNQLAQWFSPELLAQASAGKLPHLNVNQALSLEEFERSIQQHSSTAVHN